MRVFVTGDIHGNLDWDKMSEKMWPEQKKLTRDDVLIIAGDFSIPWKEQEDPFDRYLLNNIEEKLFTTVFIDGNYENFKALNLYPVTKFHEAECHQLRPHIFHLMRGEVMNLDGLKILGFGGAVTYKSRSSIHGKTVWKEEKPTEEEFRKAYSAVMREKPDAIITHDGPSEFVRRIYQITDKPTGKHGYRPSDVLELGTADGMKVTALFNTIVEIPKD